MSTLIVVPLIILIYAGIAVGRIPYLRMDRVTIALVGAMLLVALGTISEDEAIAALDVGTILLLGAMMIINNNLRLAGFFRLTTTYILGIAQTPQTLLAVIVATAGVLSALFLNDTICLMLTPIVVDMTQRLERNPVPYLIGLATATNIGSTATITGNPQNLIIGRLSDIPYLTFLVYMAPIALLGLIICWGGIVLAFPAEFKGKFTPIALTPPQIYPPLLWRTLGVVFGLLVAFLLGFPIVTVACIAAGALLVSRLRPAKLLDIDWGLLAFFAGLFVVTGALESSGISHDIFHELAPILNSGVGPLSVITALLSNAISNVPAVLLLSGEIEALDNPRQGWLTLAMSSTLAGNFTLLGSAANLIVAELAAKRGVRLTFMQYLRVGIPITLLTLLVGMIWLSVVAG